MVGTGGRHRPLVAGTFIRPGHRRRGGGPPEILPVVPSDLGGAGGTLTGLATRVRDNQKVLVACQHLVSTNGWAVSGGEPIYQIAVNNSDNVGRLLAGGWVPVRGRHISSPSFLFRQRRQEQRLYEVEEQ